MATLASEIKLFYQTFNIKANHTTYEAAIDTWITNGVEGISSGADIASSTTLDPVGRGSNMLFGAVFIGAPDGAYNASARLNETTTITRTLRLDSGSDLLATDVTALETALQAWIDNGGDGITAAAGVDVSVAIGKTIQGSAEAVITLVVKDRAEGSVFDDKMLYVKIDGDDVNGDGSFDAPYALPSTAVTDVIARGDNTVDVPYGINIGPGVFDDNIVLESTDLYNLVFLGASSASTVIRPSSDEAIKSEADNDNLERLRFYGMRFEGPVTMEGATDSTDFGSGLVFDNCFFNADGDISVNNSVQALFRGCSIGGDATFYNIDAVVYQANTSHTAGALSIGGDNGAAKKPSTWTGETIFVDAAATLIMANLSIPIASDDVSIMHYGEIDGNFTVLAGASLTMFDGYIMGDVTMDGTIGGYGTIEGNLEFTAASPVSSIYNTHVTGDVVADNTSGAVNWVGGGWLGSLTDPGPVVAYSFEEPSRPADTISVEDTATVFTGTNAEAVLSELGPTLSPYQVYWTGNNGSLAITPTVATNGITPALGDKIVYCMGNVTATNNPTMPVIGTDIAVLLVDSTGIKVDQLSASDLSGNTYYAMVLPIG